MVYDPPTLYDMGLSPEAKKDDTGLYDIQFCAALPDRSLSPKDWLKISLLFKPCISQWVKISPQDTEARKRDVITTIVYSKVNLNPNRQLIPFTNQDKTLRLRPTTVSIVAALAVAFLVNGDNRINTNSSREAESLKKRIGETR
ncbi:hypothetical protein AYI68_g8122 [Smittium mucronatum]|uniref:Uncharacterized protein n=1 Tax=Smittium mucronatum TaxID=133383 RepID=A0A1R0GLS2_9FUNG|nr:hypothetical protein AYI68_g8122 [Smittium mucronatum]